MNIICDMETVPRWAIYHVYHESYNNLIQSGAANVKKKLTEKDVIN